MKELIFNLVNGVRSGIPICCNLFFSYRVLIKPDCQVADVVHEKRTGKVFDVFAVNDPDESQYVQCNRCYAKNKVKEIRDNGVILSFLIKDN